MTKKVFVSRPIVPDAIDKLKSFFQVEVWNETAPPPKSVLIEKSVECDAFMIEANDPIDFDVINAAKNLKIVSTRAVGYDNIDLSSATEKGILIGNTPGILHESCADFAMGLILTLGRRISYSHHNVLKGNWKVFDQTPYLGTDVHGKTLGLLGVGMIGSAVAKRASGFNMKIIYHSRSRKIDLENQLGLIWKSSLDEMLQESDYVSIHVPLNDDTKKIIGKRELDLMKSDSFLINTSRGGTIDQLALTNALKTHQILGAALDVTDPEPIAHDDPLVSMENVIITPHISSASAATLRNMGIMAADNIIHFFTEGKMLACLNPELMG